MWYLFVITLLLAFFCGIAPVREGLLINEKKKISIRVRRGDVFFFFIAYLLFFLTAFRGSSIGNDTASYIYIFKTILAKGTIDTSFRYEVGYQAFNLLVGMISTDSQAIIIATSIFTYFLVTVYIKKHSYVPIYAIAIFFGLYFSTFTNTIRQAMVFCILLFAYDAIEKNKKIKSIILIALAASFQKTALLFVPFAIVRFFKIKFTPKIFALLSLATLVLAVSGSTLLSLLSKIAGSFDEYYLRYLNSSRVGSGYLGVVFSLIILLAMWIAYLVTTHKKNRTDGEKWLFGFCLLFYILALVMNSFDRVAQIFEIMLIVPVTNSILSSNSKNKKIIICVLVLFVLLSFIVKVILRPEWNNLYPYSFFWENT